MLRPKDCGGLGFRVMRLFNQALLARQAWRLIQYPDTLCAQLLKAKYFPNGLLIDSVFTGNRSSTWHAIQYGLELLKQLVIWRVGNGAQIRASRDPWIPRDSNHRPRSAQGRCRYHCVADFLQPGGSWNLQSLHLYFEQEDIEEIIKIKTSPKNEQDFIAWHPEKRGTFTVRNAYRLALAATMQFHAHGATSFRPNGEIPSWKYHPKWKILT
jgi:hypothetical protein